MELEDGNSGKCAISCHLIQPQASSSSSIDIDQRSAFIIADGHDSADFCKYRIPLKHLVKF